MNDVAVVVGDPDLAQAVSAVVAGSGIAPTSTVLPGTSLLVTDDVPPALSVPTVVVAGGHDPDLWQRASRAGVEQVVMLPGGAEILGRRLSRRPASRSGTMVRVVGARGGVGATTLAVGLAWALSTGARVVLVDGDSHGGGLDLALGLEKVAGLRWDELTDVRGLVPPRSILGRLPRVDGLPVVSHGRDPGHDPVGAWPAVTESLLRAADYAVCDVPRFHLPQLAPAASCVDVLVVPHDIAGVAAARKLIDRAAVRADAVLAIRRVKGPVHVSAVTDAIPHHPAIELPRCTAVRAATDFGDLASAVQRGAYAATCQSLAEAVVTGDSRS